MTLTIATAGKGGTGKTTLAGLLVRALVEEKMTPVLAVDADPNSCLHESLGTEPNRTVADLTEELKAAEGAPAPGGMTRDVWMEYGLQGCLTEETGFDLLTMGKPEGAGCYCYANNLVRGCIDALTRSYKAIVMDNEAGLEHLSRRTTRDVDVLLLVADPSVRGIRTVARLSALADELGIDVGTRMLVVNRASEPLHPALIDEAAAAGLPITAVIPNDPAVGACDLGGDGLQALPDDSPSVVASRRLLKEVLAQTAAGAV